MINDINNRVKEVRQSMNLSQAKFAQEIGFSQGGIKGIENGFALVTAPCTLRQIKKMLLNRLSTS